MHFAFQDRDNLFLVLDYMSGGDLRYHVGRMRRFNEDQTSTSSISKLRVLYGLYLLGT